jgi:hypothetical protein
LTNKTEVVAIATLVFLALVAGFGIRPLLLLEPTPELKTPVSVEINEDQMQEIRALYNAIIQFNTTRTQEVTDPQLQAELNDARAEVARLKTILESLQETNGTTLVIPPPKMFGRIDWREIGTMLKKITPNAGCIAGSYNVTTKEEVERFLAITKYPENMEPKAKPWYLMGKLMEWAGSDLCAGYFSAFKEGAKDYKVGVAVIVQDSDGENKLFKVNEDNQLIPFELNYWDSLTVTFP